MASAREKEKDAAQISHQDSAGPSDEELPLPNTSAQASSLTTLKKKELHTAYNAISLSHKTQASSPIARARPMTRTQLKMCLSSAMQEISGAVEREKSTLARIEDVQGKLSRLESVEEKGAGDDLDKYREALEVSLKALTADLLQCKTLSRNSTEVMEGVLAQMAKVEQAARDVEDW